MVRDRDTPAPEAPPLWPSLLACAAAAAWVDLGTIHRFHHSDTLINPLISLWRWTPFYWGQDRIGTLVPLLAMPVANPLANLLVQEFLNIFTGLAAFVLTARYVLRGPAYPLVGLLSAAAFVGLTPPAYQAMYFMDAGYGVWLTLGLGGLLAVQRRLGGTSPPRFALGTALIVLAHWVNVATALILGPLVVSRALFVDPAPGGSTRGRSSEGFAARVVPGWLRRLLGLDTAAAPFALALGVAAGLAMMWSAPADVVPTSLGSLPPLEWPEAWRGLLKNHWESLAPQRLPLVLACAAVLGLSWLRRPGVRPHSPDAWRAAAALGLAAAVIWLYTGTTHWARLNGYAYRYFMPPALMLQTAILTVGAAPPYLASGPGARRGLTAAAVVALFAGAAHTFGFPSASGVRADIDRTCGAMTDDLIAARCTHLTGSYQRVWPAVFHAYLVLHERGEMRAVWALTGRSEATADLWRSVPPDQVRLAVPFGEARWANETLNKMGSPNLSEVDRKPTIRVFRFQDAPPPPPPPGQ